MKNVRNVRGKRADPVYRIIFIYDIAFSYPPPPGATLL